MVTKKQQPKKKKGAPLGNSNAKGHGEGRPKICGVVNMPENGKLPVKDVDINQVLYWAKLQASQEEVAGCFGICVETLNSRLLEASGLTYSEIKKQHGGEAKTNLRRFQYRLAESNPTMAIWLGKIWLGQREQEEKQKVDHEFLARHHALMSQLHEYQKKSQESSSSLNIAERSINNDNRS